MKRKGITLPPSFDDVMGTTTEDGLSDDARTPTAPLASPEEIEQAISSVVNIYKEASRRGFPFAMYRVMREIDCADIAIETYLRSGRVTTGDIERLAGIFGLTKHELLHSMHLNGRKWNNIQRHIENRDLLDRKLRRR